MSRKPFVVALILAAGSAFAAPVPVTTCGQVVSALSAELTQDLDCSAFVGDAVRLSSGGRFAMNGFTIIGDAGRIYHGIVCDRRCTVSGPGTLSGGNVAALQYFTYGRITVDGVTITGAKTGALGSIVTVRNSTLVDNDYGVAAYNPPFSSAVIRDSTISGSGLTGVVALRIRLVNSSVTGSGDACPPGQTCCDLVAQNSVRLRGTSTCETSCANSAAGTPFGVCTYD